MFGLIAICLEWIGIDLFVNQYPRLKWAIQKLLSPWSRNQVAIPQPKSRVVSLARCGVQAVHPLTEAVTRKIATSLLKLLADR